MNFDNITSPFAFPVSAIFACEDSRFFIACSLINEP
nr:MAG TPA: hypothetical protein [Caudoviricetes sp.]